MSFCENKHLSGGELGRANGGRERAVMEKEMGEEKWTQAREEERESLQD